MNKVKEIVKLSLICLISTSIISIILGIFLKSLEKVSTVFSNASYLIVFLPICGVLVSILYQKYGNNADKGNTLIFDVYKNNNKLPVQMAILAPFATILSHLFGASIGREGIGLQVSSSVFSYFSNLFKLSDKHKQILLLSAASAGFGIIFQTPLSGIIFGHEFFKKRKIIVDSIFYSAVSSYFGIIIIRSMGVHHTNYKSIELPEMNIKFILALVCFGLVSGLGAWLYIKLVEVIKNKYEVTLINKQLRIFVGGLMIIIFVLVVQTIRYQGLGLNLIEDAFAGTVKWYDGLLKILITSLSVGGGFYGGEVTPLFASGASLGSVVATYFLLPASLGAALGYISLFSSAAHAPLTGIMLGMELFGIAGLPVYIVVCCISFYVNRKQNMYKT